MSVQGVQGVFGGFPGGVQLCSPLEMFAQHTLRERRSLSGLVQLCAGIFGGFPMGVQLVCNFVQLALHNGNKSGLVRSLHLPRLLLALIREHPLVAFFGDVFEPFKLPHHPANAIMSGAVSVGPSQRLCHARQRAARCQKHDRQQGVLISPLDRLNIRPDGLGQRLGDDGRDRPPLKSFSASQVTVRSWNPIGGKSGPRNLPCHDRSTTLSFFRPTKLPSNSATKAPPPRGSRLSLLAFLVGWQQTRTHGPPGSVVRRRNTRACFPICTLSFSSSPPK